MNVIDKINKEKLRKGIPNFRAGDTLRVHCKIREGDKERIQIFEGVCIARKGGGISASFIVRKTSYGIGVERIFPLHSPQLDRIEVASAGKVRRAKLYYLRKLFGKAARIEGRQYEETPEGTPEGTIEIINEEPSDASAITAPAQEAAVAAQ